MNRVGLGHASRIELLRRKCMVKRTSSTAPATWGTLRATCTIDGDGYPADVDEIADVNAGVPFQDFNPDAIIDYNSQTGMLVIEQVRPGHYYWSFAVSGGTPFALAEFDIVAGQTTDLELLFGRW